MAKMTNDELASKLSNEIESATGNFNTELSEQREQSMKYYLGEPFGNEIEGRSEIVTTDVRDTIEYIMPSLMRIFTTHNNVAEFEPEGPEDVQMAQQATDYVNYVFNRQNNGFKVLYDVFKDALISKTGIVKHYWEEKTEVSTENYTNLTEIEYQSILANDDMEVIEHTETVVQKAVTDDFGNLISPKVVEHDVKVKKTKDNGQVRVVSVPPEEFLVSRRSTSIEDASFVCHRVKKTVSDLILEGYDPAVVEDLPTYTTNNAEYDEERIARFSFDDDSIPADEGEGPSRKVWLEECYIHLDYDGDGIAELRKITKGGNIILDNEEIDSVPFSTICPLPIPHKFHGMSIADTVQDIQLIKSTIMRNLLDNMYLTNNARYAVLAGQVELDDLLSSKPGGIVRMRAPGAVTALPTPQIQPYAFQMVQYLDGIREERSGVSKMSQGLNPDVLTSHVTSGAISAATESAMQRVELIARIFAETGIKDLFRNIYSLIQRYENRQKMAYLNGKFVPIDVSKWKEKLNCTVNVGVGSGNQNSKMQTMSGIMTILQTVVQNGGMGSLVTPQNLYNAISEFIAQSGYKNSDMFISNPQMMPPQPPPEPTLDEKVAAQKAQVELQKLQLQAQELEIDTQLKAQELKLKQEEAAIDLAIKQQELQIKKSQLELNEAELALEATQGRPVGIGPR
ncbi:putative portal protein [uncultured virus]|jgi:hypothetical protein|uniref:Putative portal protein n=1 Tax=uncultured virus TaxID=340016 RepID=A0A218MLX1_9VIRU|nr:putative portal protein [uncultured virus]